MNSCLPTRFVLMALVGFCLGMVADVDAADQVTLDVKLIWATNHDQPPDKEFKRADDKLSKDLQQAFKWKNYFIINSKEAVAEKNKKEKLEMSDQCRLQFNYLGDDKFEVWIWGTDAKTGEEKALAKGTQKMAANQKVLLMGVNDNESGWVVKICRHAD